MDSKKLREAWKKVGNKFALTVLLQKRCQELVRGSKALVETDKKNPIEIALEEVLAGKIWLGDRPAGLPALEPFHTAAGAQEKAEKAAAASAAASAAARG